MNSHISLGIGINRLKIEEAPLQIAEVAKAPMEAFNNFLRGRKDFRKLYLNDARHFLKKATELDPTFATAYRYFGFTYFFLGDIKARNEVYQKAMSCPNLADVK